MNENENGAEKKSDDTDRNPRLLICLVYIMCSPLYLYVCVCAHVCMIV